LGQIRLEAQSLAQRVTAALNVTRNETVEAPQDAVAVDRLAMSFERDFTPGATVTPV
jgi:hypothetical protein